jgi:biotin carboxyl carrier protein
VSDDRVGPDQDGAGATPGDSLEALTHEILPALVARLRASRLGELEVRTDGWRVRLRRDTSNTTTRTTSAPHADDGEAMPSEPAGSVARSPAVGYFDPLPDLVVGASVQAGDLLGTVDVLGIVQEVTAPTDGIISAVLADGGQAVEYGQALAEIDVLEMDLGGLDSEIGSAPDAGELA